jgi:D-methionine transport system substrate-binding protein
MGIFSSKYKSLDELPNGATVAIPNDETNLSRAIRVLQQAGLVKIKDGVDPAKATQNDLSENKKNLKFTEIEAPQLPRSLDSVDFAVINGNYAISAGLLLKDARYSEELGEGYFNVIAVRTEDKDSQLAKDLIEITESDAFKSVIEDESKQYSSFKKPSGY